MKTDNDRKASRKGRRQLTAAKVRKIFEEFGLVRIDSDPPPEPDRSIQDGGSPPDIAGDDPEGVRTAD